MSIRSNILAFNSETGEKFPMDTDLPYTYKSEDEQVYGTLAEINKPSNMLSYITTEMDCDEMVNTFIGDDYTPYHIGGFEIYKSENALLLYLPLCSIHIYFKRGKPLHFQFNEYNKTFRISEAPPLNIDSLFMILSGGMQ